MPEAIFFAVGNDVTVVYDAENVTANWIIAKDISVAGTEVAA